MFTDFTYTQELKIQILARGITVSEKAKSAWEHLFSGPMSLSEYASTSGICLCMEGDIWINAPFIEKFTEDATATLDFIEDGFYVVYREQRSHVKVIPVPAFHNKFYRNGGKEFRYTNIGITHTDRCRISPIQGCAWVCTFCDLPYKRKYQKQPKEELLKVVQIAAEDPVSPARHVLISGGTPRPEDEVWIDEVYSYVAGNSPIPVNVMMPPRKDLTYPRRLKDFGVSTLSVNIEVFGKKSARSITPNKARILGIDYYLEYIKEAVKILGVGFVQSLIVFGKAIEETASTLAGVQALAERGCMPILSPFRPDSSTPLGKGGASPASIEEMKMVYCESLEICSNSGTGVKLGPRCVPCMHNTLTFPDGSSFYVPLGKDLSTPVQFRECSM